MCSKCGKRACSFTPRNIKEYGIDNICQCNKERVR